MGDHIHSARKNFAFLGALAVKSFQEKVAAAAKDSTIQIKGAKISSYASPDGEYDLNEKLSGKRGTAAERYLTRALKKAKVEGYDVEGFLSSLETAEDWDGFKELMEASDIEGLFDYQDVKIKVNS